MKRWYKSRTLWLNFASVILAIAAMPQTLAVIPLDWLPWVGLVVGLGNKFLRFDTDTAIGPTDDVDFNGGNI